MSRSTVGSRTRREEQSDPSRIAQKITVAESSREKKVRESRGRWARSEAVAFSRSVAKASTNPDVSSRAHGCGPKTERKGGGEVRTVGILPLPYVIHFCL